MDAAADPVNQLLTEFRPLLDGALIATDFDGTLAPLQLDPEQSRPVDGTIPTLLALRAAGAEIAVITGRDAGTVVRLGGLDAVPGLRVAGVYGAETWAAGRLQTPPTPDSVHRLRERLPAAVEGGDPAIWIEDKRLSLVVHARHAADPETALAELTPAVQVIADDLGFEVHPGSGVLELRLPGFDKARALAGLVDELRPSALLFLGDDLGDLPAMAETRRRRDNGLPAWSVAVRSSGVDLVAQASDVQLADPDAVVALLAALAAPAPISG